jgi:hypothetical protein
MAGYTGGKSVMMKLAVEDHGDDFVDIEVGMSIYLAGAVEAHVAALLRAVERAGVTQRVHCTR